ncbi:hypothetical protein Dda_9120 [Drechslerella dactyloides]|uniref:Uncharacterized protein n=1 Tax=Drechslerella dactyloides TaxID=74499 RepID=A0AAD6NGS4_DREDA|nr:hypothetical protein Dda_9120 [Drechslerella dactyloides]
MAPARILSTHDSTVLEQIFDPESAPTPSPVTIDAALAPFPNTPTRTLSSLRASEILAIRAAEANDTSKALAILSQAVASSPSYCSAYNNRAQVRRMAVANTNPGDIDNLFSESSDTRTAIAAAYVDLSTAISLAQPQTPTSPISPQTAKLLANAHTQRATILHTSSKHLTAGSKLPAELPEELAVLGDDVAAWEEAASRDFFWGGRYGNELAKAMAVHTNPYAKLCGSIVKEAMKKEIGEAY